MSPGTMVVRDRRGMGEADSGTLLLYPPPAEATRRVLGLGQVVHGGPLVTAVEGAAGGIGVALTILGVVLRGVNGIVGDIAISVGSSVVAASVFSAVSRRF